MTQPTLLNNVDHGDLRIVTTRGEAWGDAMMSAVAVPAEFRSLQAHYPIVFQKTADGTGFQPIALFGLQDGQNLFLGPRGWDAHTLPMSIERQPFLIGIGGADGNELLMQVDQDSPRLITGAGPVAGGFDAEPVFLPHGGHTEFLERINSLLLALHDGVQATPAFVEALLANDLLESFVLDVELVDGSQSRLAGLYTINEDRLASLDGAALDRLNRAGHLQAIYMALASVANFRDLIERLNRRLAPAA